LYGFVGIALVWQLAVLVIASGAGRAPVAGIDVLLGALFLAAWRQAGSSRNMMGAQTRLTPRARR
jgi:hypothetical protein